MNEQIIEFLTELRSHNNREWFQDNKNRYDALRKVFIDEVQDLIGRISLFDPEVSRNLRLLSRNLHLRKHFRC